MSFFKPEDEEETEGCDFDPMCPHWKGLVESNAKRDAELERMTKALEEAQLLLDDFYKKCYCNKETKHSACRGYEEWLKTYGEK